MVVNCTVKLLVTSEKIGNTIWSSYFVLSESNSQCSFQTHLPLASSIFVRHSVKAAGEWQQTSALWVTEAKVFTAVQLSQKVIHKKYISFSAILKNKCLNVHNYWIWLQYRLCCSTICWWQMYWTPSPRVWITKRFLLNHFRLSPGSGWPICPQPQDFLS